MHYFNDDFRRDGTAGEFAAVRNWSKHYLCMHLFALLFMKYASYCIKTNSDTSVWWHDVASVAMTINYHSCQLWVMVSLKHRRLTIMNGRLKFRIHIRKRKFPLEFLITVLRIASKFAGRSAVWSRACSNREQRNIKGPYHRPYVRGIPRWLVNSPVDSPDNGPVMWKASPC